MSWFLDTVPGHEGSLLALLPCEDARRRADWYRELTPHDAELAKHGIFLDQARNIWRAHAIATEFAKQEAMKVRAGP